MRTTDAQALGNALTALAEVFAVRAPSANAIAVWADTLRDFPIEKVEGILRSWPKMHAKMPVPRDVWSILNDERTDDIERRAAAEKAQERREVARMFDLRVKDANMAKIRDLITSARAKGPPTGPQLGQAMIEDIASGNRKRFSIPQREFIVANMGWTQEKISEVEADAQCAYAASAPEPEEWL